LQLPLLQAAAALLPQSAAVCPPQLLLVLLLVAVAPLQQLLLLQVAGAGCWRAQLPLLLLLVAALALQLHVAESDPQTHVDQRRLRPEVVAAAVVVPAATHPPWTGALPVVVGVVALLAASQGEVVVEPPLAFSARQESSHTLTAKS
jgi:hypothetical protein